MEMLYFDAVHMFVLLAVSAGRVLCCSHGTTLLLPTLGYSVIVPRVPWDLLLT